MTQETKVLPTQVKKPIKKDYCKSFSLDNSLQTFDSKKYAADAAKYIDNLESQKSKLIEALKDVIEEMEAGYITPHTIAKSKQLLSQLQSEQ